MDGPSRANSASNDSLGTNPPTAALDTGDARNGEQSEVPSETSGFPNITLAVKDGFEPHGANRAVIDYIKKYYKKPIISYKEAPLKVKEVWFNEFKKKYRWIPEHDVAIQCSFDVKASERLSNALYDVHAEKILSILDHARSSSQAPAHTSSSTTSYETEDLHLQVAELENTKRLFMVAFKKILGINYPSIFQSDQEMVINGRHVNDANQSVGVDGDGTGVTTIDYGGMVLPRENE
nr:dual specificity protein kinase shkD-like [Ipomoea batatas]